MLKKRLFAGILTVAMTVAMCFGGATAYASDEEGGTPSTSVTSATITKEFQMDKYVPVPTKTFNFKFTKVTSGEGIDTGSTPTINNQSITFTASTDEPSDIPANVEIKNVQKQISVTLPEAGSFGKVGVYRYLVEEVADSGAPDYEFSNAAYYMDIHVVNDGDGLKIDKVTMQNTQKPSAPEQKEQHQEEGKVDTMKFVNKYIPKADLEIQKLVTGAYGDKQKEFTFTVLLHRSPIYGITGDTIKYTGKVYDSPSASTASKEVTFTTGTPTTLTLKHNQILKFENLPVGTKYIVTEAPDGYTPSVEVKENGVVMSDKKGHQNGTNFELGDGVVTEDNNGKNSAVFTNDKNNSTVATGILMNNLPFFLMIAAAILGFAAYVAVKSHKAKR